MKKINKTDKYYIGDYTGSVLFLDIENFMGISDTLTPEETYEFIHTAIRPLADVVMRHKGHICQIQGDAIMAIFGHKISSCEHARNAVCCALEQQSIIRQLNPVSIKQYKIPLSARIGVCSGPVYAVYSDISGKTEYTVLGQTANIASRLQKINKRYDTNILIDESLISYIRKDVVTRKLDVVHPEGCKDVLQVYEVLFLCSEQRTELLRQKNKYEEGLEYYFQGKWDEAISCFSLISEDRASYLMIERCRKKIPAPVVLCPEGKIIK
jgi:adenylate cyclase